MKRLTVLVVAALSFGVVLISSAHAAEFDKFGIASVNAELSTNQAGAHPDFTTEIQMATNPSSPIDATGLHIPYGHVGNVKVSLPPGLLANLNAADTCSAAQFVTSLVPEAGSGCPFSSQVGVAVLHIWSLQTAPTVPIYSVETAGEGEVARLGFFVTTVPAFIDVRVRSDGDYGVTAEATGISSASPLVSVKTTLWGVPADSSHDTQRLTVQEGLGSKSQSPSRSSGRGREPFMTNPTTCGQHLEIGFEADSYEEPGKFSKKSAPLGEITGCPKLSFEPSFSATPTTREAAAPSGLDADLKIPQNEAFNGLATSQLRDTVVKLPAGMTIAAGAADGLAACSVEEVGYGHSPPEVARCPEASKIATAEIDSPALSRPVQGAVYQRTPEAGNLFRVWLVADELGVHVKIPGDIHLDPKTGQLTSLFLDTPQVPVREFKLHFKGGARGVLATPSTCGTYQSAYQLTPWSGGALAEGVTPMTIDQRCSAGGFKPKLSAGTANPSAGAFSPFVTDVTSEAGEQNVSGLDVTLPSGVLAKLAGVSICQEAAAVSGNCPAASQVGTTTVATGPGPSPLWIPQPGKDPTAIYLAGPYKGGPYSLLVKTPAQAGPFDLGTVLVRAAIHVDPETARVSVASDPLPQILEGVPVSYRDIHVDVNRPGFTLNPTSCDPTAVTGQIAGAGGALANVSDRFQAAGCSSLAFQPRLTLKLKGATKRNGNPALTVTLAARPGDANIGRAQVTLPHSEFLDQSHIGTVCTRVQFAAADCPSASVYGRAKVITPLLDRPLEGLVYLRSSANPLPDLVADLNGQIHVVLDGRIDSVNGGIRSTFESVPDAPVSKFVLEMKGGKKGLLVNSRNLCKATNRATVLLTGQNGKVSDSNPALQRSCGKVQHKKRPKR